MLKLIKEKRELTMIEISYFIIHMYYMYQYVLM